jgi:hypothetical protein
MMLSRWLPYVAVLAIVAIAAYALLFYRSPPSSQAVSPSVPPVAVLGDSDSHSYQDRISFAPASGERGAEYRDISLQWTEVLARLRGDALDFGAWGVYGTSRIPAYIAKKLGIVVRKPRREDYRYNFAMSGAECSDLMAGWEEAPALVRLMDDEPARWQHGIVIVRIGINTFGKLKQMEGLARDPPDPDVIARIDGCIGDYKNAVALIRTRYPGTRFVLVGIFDNLNWSRYFERWQSPGEVANIQKGLDRFDDALRAMAAADPNIAFFDDRAWFRARWGSRDADGRPAYRTVRFAGLDVVNAEGNAPHNLALEDGHSGLVSSTLWAQSMLRLMNERFGLGIRDIDDAEAARFVQAQLDKAPNLPR